MPWTKRFPRILTERCVFLDSRSQGKLFLLGLSSDSLFVRRAGGFAKGRFVPDMILTDTRRTKIRTTKKTSYLFLITRFQHRKEELSKLQDSL